MELRAAADGDLEAMREVFLAAVGELFGRFGLTPPSPSQAAFSAIQRHVAATGRSVVAERDGRLEGFGAAFTRGEDWFLSSLFVRPGAQGRGLGTRLLDAVWSSEAARRRTITDAFQPVSNALYGRRGLVPVTPLLTFSGVPAASSSAEEAPADLAAIDAAAYGFDRSVDHDAWARAAERREWGDAYTYAFPGGELGPVAGLNGNAAARALEAELARAPGPVRLRVLGTARELVRVALGAGLRLGDAPGLLLVSDGVEPPTALAPSGYALF